MPPPPASYLDITATPYSQGVTAADFNAGTYGGVVNQAWLRFVAPLTEVFALSTTVIGAGIPKIELFDGAMTPLRDWTGLFAGGIPVTGGTTYYAKLTTVFPVGAATHTFTVTADVDTYITSVPANGFILNDDKATFPATVWDIDGTRMGYAAAVPGGEMGAIIAATGTQLWHNRFGTPGAFMRLVDDTLATIANVDLTPGLGVGSNFPRISADLTQFWVVNVLTGTVYTVQEDGTVSGVVATVSDGGRFPFAAAVSRDGTTLFWVKTISGGTTDNVIRRWDLVNNVALPDLYTIAALSGVLSYRVAKTPNNHPGDILVLADGSIVTWYRNITLGRDTLIQVSAAGVLLRSAIMPSSTIEIDHLAYAPLDPTRVYLWRYLDYAADGGATGEIGDFDLIAGDYASSFPTDMFLNGVNLVGQSTLFGPSSSCTFLTRLVAIPPALGTLRVTKVTVPGGDPQVFTFVAGGGLLPTSFTLLDLESILFPDLTPGSGYTIVEITVSGYTTTYVVSNGSPIDNITVAAGELVVVTVTNTLNTIPVPPVTGFGCPTQFPVPLGPRDPGCAIPFFP